MSPKKLTDPPEVLDEESKARIKKWCKENYPHKFKSLGNLWCECADWHLSNGVERANWEATFRNWIRTSDKFDKDKKRKEGDRYWNETPQESRAPGSRELTPIIEIIAGEKK